MQPLIRAVVAVVAGLAFAITAAQLIRWGALAILQITGPRDTVVGLGVLANIALVPIAAGLPIGLIAQRYLFPLSVVTVVVSLLGTYASLGPAGLPHGLKILSYVLQLTLIYLAARFAANARRSRTRTSMRAA